MNKHTTKTAILQDLFSHLEANVLKKSNFIKRCRKITVEKWLEAGLNWVAASVVTLSTFVFQLTLLGIKISRQALHKHFNEDCVNFLKSLLEKTLEKLVLESCFTQPALFQKFNHVFIGDCTSVPLSSYFAEKYPGCGGSDGKTGKAGLKWFLRMDAASGEIETLKYDSARTSDHKFINEAPPLPDGSLELLDMGFYTFDRLRKLSITNRFFITRVQTLTIIWVNGRKMTLPEFFLNKGKKNIDILCEVGQSRLPVRLVAKPAPKDVVRKRLLRLAIGGVKRNRTVSERQKSCAYWTFYITNIPQTRCSIDEIFILYGVRWQIELVFKLWKSEAWFGKSGAKTTCRSLCEQLLQMIHILISHWLVIQEFPHMSACSPTLLYRCLRKFLPELLSSILAQTLNKTKNILAKISRYLASTPTRANCQKAPYTLKKLEREYTHGLS